MAVTLRLSRRGQTKRPFYRVVAAEKTMRRDGRFLEILGTYNTMVEPHAVALKEDLIKKWLTEGAQVSDTVASLIKKQFPGFLEAIIDVRLKKKQAARKARKTRSAGKTKTAAKKK